MIAYAKANPGKLSVGSPGMGTPHSLAALMLNAAAGIEITHVPYKGTAPALNDLLGGQIPLMWATPNVVMQYVQTGKVKALAVGSPQRVALLPNVPTVAESGVPGFDVSVWFGIAGPAKMPPGAIARISREIAAIDQMTDCAPRWRRSAMSCRISTAPRLPKRSPPTTRVTAKSFAMPGSSRTRVSADLVPASSDHVWLLAARARMSAAHCAFCARKTPKTQRQKSVKRR